MNTAILRIWYPDGRTEDRTLGLGHHEIGRSVGAIVVDDPGVSSRHARVIVELGRVMIEDLGSSNGTTDANGTRIQGVLVMQPHQAVQMGSTRVALISTSTGPQGTQLLPVMGGAPLRTEAAAGLAVAPGLGPPPSAPNAPPGYGPPPSAPNAPPGYGAPPPGYGAPPPGYGAPPPGYGAPPPGQGMIQGWQGMPPQPSPEAPYGIDPVTGRPFSDKTKLAAGLLQLCFGWLAIGRFYLGYTSIALAQIVLCLLVGIGGSFFTCGASMFVFLWPVIDGILMLMGKVPDAQGRPLRS